MAYFRRLIFAFIFLISFVPSAFAMDQGEAWLACNEGQAAQIMPIINECFLADDHTYQYDAQGDYGIVLHGVYPFTSTCSDRDSLLPADLDEDPPEEGALACNNGCQYEAVTLEDSFGYIPTGQVCSPNDNPEEPPSDTDGDGTPDDEDAFPTDPGESADSDGDGIGDNADTDDGDSDNGADEGDGNEGDNQSAGGGTCASQPTCSGDAIQCNILFQQWKTRCNSESKTSTGGANCSTPPTSTGDAIESQIALQTWKTRCATETLASGIAAVNSNVAAQTALLAGAYGEDQSGQGQGTNYEGSDGWLPGQEETEEEVELDTSGWLSDRTCPVVPDVDVFGDTIHFDISVFCDFLSIGAGLILVFAQIACMRLIGTAI